MNKNWKYKKISEVMSVERGGSPRPIQKYLTDSKDGINWIKISDATASDKYIYKTKQKITKEGLHKTRLVTEGDFLLSNSMSFGRPYIMKTTGCIHDGWLVLKEKEHNILDKDFLYHLLGSPYIFEQFDKLAAGSTVRNLNIKLVSSVEIPILPVQEQKQIVEILDKAFSAIDQAKANIEKNIVNAKELFQSKLNAIFSQKGDGWEEKTFQELSTRIGDGLHGTPKYDSNGDYYFINGNNLNDGKIEIKVNTKKVNKEEFEKHKKILTQNTVLVSINGTLGKVAFYNDEPVILGKSACYINFNKEVNKHYIKYLVKSSIFFKNMVSLSTGATIKNFSLKSMRNYTLYLPSLIEQETRVNQLNNIEKRISKVESNYYKQLKDLEELKKSILQKAFSGELTQKEVVV